MDEKKEFILKCIKCNDILSQDEIRSHQCEVDVKLEEPIGAGVDSGEGFAEVEFLESECEGLDDDSVDDGITDLLTSDWSETEVSFLLDVTITRLESGDLIDTEPFWKKVMGVFNKDERWPLFVVKAKLQQLRQLFDNDPYGTIPRYIIKKLEKISELEKKNCIIIKDEAVTGTSGENWNASDDDAKQENDYDTMRWTGREINQLVKAYKRHVRDLLATNANKDKRKIWDQIAAEVDMSGSRRCDPYAARMKMMNLKKTWLKHKNGTGRVTWHYFKLMEEVMCLERRIKTPTVQFSDSDLDRMSDCSDEEYLGRLDNDCLEQPEWFARFRQEARRRHGEKMKIKLRLLNVLEKFVDKLSK